MLSHCFGHAGARTRSYLSPRGFTIDLDTAGSLEQNQGAGLSACHSVAARRDGQRRIGASTGLPARRRGLCGPAQRNLAGARLIDAVKERTRGVVVSVRRGTQPRELVCQWSRDIYHPPPTSWPHAGCFPSCRRALVSAPPRLVALLGRCLIVVALVQDLFVFA